MITKEQYDPGKSVDPEKKADGQYAYNITFRHVCNVYCSGKAKSITYNECVFVKFGNQHVVHIIVLSVASVAVKYISITIKQHKFWKKMLLDIKFVFYFSLQHFSF